MKDKLREIEGALEPIKDFDWVGKWRIIKALSLLREVREEMERQPPAEGE